MDSGLISTVSSPSLMEGRAAVKETGCGPRWQKLMAVGAPDGHNPEVGPQRRFALPSISGYGSTATPIPA